ncbi:THUMP domain-containing class I SAM-dependent RNA methyltransferase [Maricaulis sp. CAU 1757]
MSAADFEIFLVTAPGLESVLAEEVRALGLGEPRLEAGGVTIRGSWPDVWRANLWSRCATRVLARIAEFPAVHLSQLDKKARQVDWAAVLRPDVPVHVEASSRGSKIYHQGAAAERVGKAITETLGAPLAAGVADAGIRVRLRIERNLCTLSIDTSGELLHRRGHKAAVAKAPLRETLAASFLRAAGYDGSAPVVDPMCGSGTFVLEAAEMAAGLAPGRERGFAFEQLATFDAAAWRALKETLPAPREAGFTCRGSDRDAGAVRMAQANAERAGLAGRTGFEVCDVRQLKAPDGPKGWVMINPPYGARIGNKRAMFGLYGALGDTLRREFAGWRVGLVTTDAALARACRLPFGAPGRPVDHGGLKIRLFQTGPLDQG